jgi:hypothetical protein
MGRMGEKRKRGSTFSDANGSKVSPLTSRTADEQLREHRGLTEDERNLNGSLVSMTPTTTFFSARKGRRGRMGRMGEKRKRGSTFFSYALLPPIPPILPLLPVLGLKKSRAMLLCQIKRLNKTDPEEPYTET